MCGETEMWDAQLVVGDERRLSPHHQDETEPGYVGDVGELTTSQRRVSPHQNNQQHCETTTGIAIDPFDVIVASMIGHVRRVVMSSPSTVIDLGRKSRLFTGASREAIFLRRRKCIWPGCSALTCEADHRTPWAEGGTTSPDNGDPLCRQHNRFKATAGYITTINHETGVSRIHTSDGRELVPV